MTRYGEQASEGAPLRSRPKTPIPASGKVVGAPEMRMITDAALDCWLTTGQRFNEAFESRLAEYLNASTC